MTYAPYVISIKILIGAIYHLIKLLNMVEGSICDKGREIADCLLKRKARKNRLSPMNSLRLAKLVIYTVLEALF